MNEKPNNQYQFWVPLDAAKIMEDLEKQLSDNTISDKKFDVLIKKYIFQGLDLNQRCNKNNLTLLYEVVNQLVNNKTISENRENFDLMFNKFIILLNYINPNISYVLHLACKKDQPNLRIIEALVEKAEVNLQDDHGKTPLHILASSMTDKSTEMVKIVQLLLDHRADPNAIDTQGRTPLQLLPDSLAQKLPNLIESAMITYAETGKLTPGDLDKAECVII